MVSSLQPEKELAGAGYGPDPDAVREQLKRVLAHPSFTNSKRYPVLLAYTVEQTLLGNGGELRERTIGAEVFGREHSYDVNRDPVVRITAAEVRKRLIRYYRSPDHAGELVIEMPVGSYVPTFREPVVRPRRARTDVARGDSAPEESQGSLAVAALPAGGGERDAKTNQRRWIPMITAVAVALVAGFVLRGVVLSKAP